MRRLASAAVATGMALAVAAPAAAVSHETPNPLDVLIDAFEAPENAEFVARFLVEPADGSGTIDDPVGDFEHSTGAEPGFTPGHIDITGTWALEIDPGPLDLFGPTDANAIWAPTGDRLVEPPGATPFHTFTGDQVHDGSQYDQGGLLFGMALVDTPPFDAAGRCEYVVWVRDDERGDTFVNDPAFPQDPAGGTNVAFGLALNPEEGPGLKSGFTLELTQQGGFTSVFETDVRAFVTPGYVGITVPRGQIGQLAAINFYAFCSEEGFGFDPETSGADQTGLVEVGFDDLGSVTFEETPSPTASTSTTTTTTTTSTTLATETTSAPTAADPDVAEQPASGTAGLAWWAVALGAGAGLAALGFWLMSREEGS